MPAIVYSHGWRLFFYMNERNEPPHIHVRKGDAECKYWLHEEHFDIEPAYTYNMTPRLRREIRRIIFANFDHILAEYRGIHGGENE